MKRLILFTVALALAFVASASAYHYNSHPSWYNEPTYTHTVIINDGYGGTYYQYEREYENGYTRYAGYNHDYGRGVCVGSGCGKAYYLRDGYGYRPGYRGAYYDRAAHYSGSYCQSYAYSCGTKYNRWY